MEDITRITGKYDFGLKLTDILMTDSRNSPNWFSQDLVTGVLDVLESPEVVEGTGKKVENLFNRVITEYNARSRQFGELKLIRGGNNARILKVKYQTANDKVPSDSLEFEFKDYVGMERPRFLAGERKIIDTFRGVNKLDSRYL